MIAQVRMVRIFSHDSNDCTSSTRRSLPPAVAAAVLMALLLLLAPGVLAAGASRCFLDPVFNASELYHDYNHPYGSAFNAETNKTQELLMDFYAPPPQQDARKKRPTVLLVHGGSFVSGDKSSFGPLATVLAQRGFVVGSINYRLTGRRWGTELYCCPGNLSDQYAVDAVHDARAAVRYLRRMAPGAAWRLDTERIGIGGALRAPDKPLRSQIRVESQTRRDASSTAVH
jgi:acetyl esterase/lipase